MKSIFLSILSMLIFQQSGFAQITLLADINPGGASSIALEKGAIAQMGNTLYFSANTANQGVELWKTNGTLPGTVLVKDINPGETGSFPDHFQVMGDKMFFTADDGVNGRELWITDGTEDGTILLADIRPGSASAFEDFFFSFDASDFHVFQNQLFFRAYTDIEGLELYVSDGTSAGTKMLIEIGFGQNDGCQGDFAEMNGELYFVGFTTEHGGEIWKTDGSILGTVEVTTDLNDTPKDLTALGNLLIFVEDDGLIGSELWKSDGTNAGTSLLKDTDPNGSDGGLSHALDALEGRFFIKGNTAYFSVVDAQSNAQIWITDGTESGTENLATVGVCAPSNFVQLNDNVFFTSCEFEDNIWKTGGNSVNTEIVESFSFGSLVTSFPSFKLLYSNDVLLHLSGSKDFGPNNILYATDGGIGNAQALIDDIFNPFSSPQRFFSFGNNFIFWTKRVELGSGLEPYIFKKPLTVTGSTTSVQCNGGKDGAILIQPTGTAPFSTQWQPATATGLNPVNLAAGVYQVTVVDAVGSFGTATFQVLEPAKIVLSPTSTPQIGTELNGTATVNPTGGTPPYQYVWNTVPIQKNPTATGLAAGVYTCTVTDAYLCAEVVSTEVGFLVGTQDLAAQYHITLSPNPAADWINVQWGQPVDSAVSYRLFDGKGKLVRVFEPVGSTKLSIDGLPDGLYVLEVIMEDQGSAALRFLKNR